MGDEESAVLVPGEAGTVKKARINELVRLQENCVPRAADGSKWTSRPNADRITCPYLLSVFNNGDLVPDEDGFATREELAQACGRTGMPSWIMATALNSSTQVKDGRSGIFIFNMHAEQKNFTGEHTWSTGTREIFTKESKSKAVALYEERFTGCSENGKFYFRNTFAIIDKCMASQVVLEDAIQDKGGKLVPMFFIIVYRMTLMMFGRYDENGDVFMTVEEMRDFWLDGKYPAGYENRRRLLPSIPIMLAAYWENCKYVCSRFGCCSVFTSTCYVLKAIVITMSVIGLFC